VAEAGDVGAVPYVALIEQALEPHGERHQARHARHAARGDFGLFCSGSDGNGHLGLAGWHVRRPREMTMSTRRQFTPQQKLDILRRHLLEGVPVSDLCDEHQLNPNLFYRWQKQLFENGAAAFERDERPQEQRLQKKVAALQDKLAKKDEVIAEIMESHVQLQKSLGEA